MLIGVLQLAHLFLSIHGDVVDVPLLVLGRVVDGLVFTDVVRHVELESVESPRDKFHIALLVVERKVLYVQSTVRFDNGRKHPQYFSPRRHDSKRVHEVLETVVSAETQRNTHRYRPNIAVLKYISLHAVF